jgi:hypothetical protein
MDLFVGGCPTPSPFGATTLIITTLCITTFGQNLKKFISNYFTRACLRSFLNTLVIISILILPFCLIEHNGNKLHHSAQTTHCLKCHLITKCHYADCRLAECRGAPSLAQWRGILLMQPRHLRWKMKKKLLFTLISSVPGHKTFYSLNLQMFIIR